MKKFNYSISDLIFYFKNDNIKIVNLKSNKRPIAIMINNHDDARPYHSGLQDAYLIYEIIAEGGYTRYMALFKDKEVENIGSVRSARHYFLDYALENDATYVHWGWSPQAEDDIKTLKIDNINGLYYENKYFYRNTDLDIPLEHTGYTNMQKINKAIEDLDYRNTTNEKTLLNYVSKDLKLNEFDNNIEANKIDIEYSRFITSSYVYDEEEKNYKRYVNNKEHKDYETNKQYTFKNIIVYQVKNETIDSYGRQTLDNIGTGKGYYISNGYAIPINWEKKSRNSKTIYTLEDGTDLKVNDGNTFIEIQPLNKSLEIN